MSAFADLTSQFLAEEYAARPVMASGLGLTEYDDQLDDQSEAAFEQRQASSAGWLERFEQVPEADLDFDEGLDRDLLIASLKERGIYDEWQVWRRSPDTYLNPALRGVFGLFLHRLRPERELADAAAARLRQASTNLAAGRANLRPELVPPVLLQRAINQARAGARYASELLPEQVSEEHRAGLAEAGREAGRAYDEFADFLEGMKPQAKGDWAFGEDRYDAVLRDAELLGFTARTLRERARDEYEHLKAELIRCARELKGTDDWHAVLEELSADHPTTPEAMRQGYERSTADARDYLREHRLVSFPPGEACSVDPSPPFQRPVLAVASYMDPPSFSDSMEGHFFVPYPPDGASEEEIQKRLASNCYPGIPTTAVHEAYPGHHWHLVTAKLNPSAVRQVFGTSYFAEGWALYAERMMRERGFFSDLAQEMFQYEATIFRAARIVVDTSLHIGEMTFDEAVDFIRASTNLTEPTARAEVTRYCSWPTQASAYLTGCLEIVRIRDRFLAARGATIADTDDLRDFHDALCSSGTLPIALAERAVMAKA
jgi:uncharacterized protein (DUF885 family)